MPPVQQGEGSSDRFPGLVNDALVGSGLVKKKTSFHESKKKEFYKLLPANKADHLCQLCSDLHEI